MDKKETNKLSSLEAVRCVAFLGVFTSHTRLNAFRTLGRWGVSVFLVLSGFLMVYSYYRKGRIKGSTIKDNFIFLCNKMKRLYPLYILLTLFLFPILFMGNTRVPFGEGVLRLITSVLFISEWHFSIHSIVDVAWYLGPLALFYFVFPRILNYMENNYSKTKAYLSIVISLLIQLLIGVIGKNMGNEIGYWYVYYRPLSRIWEIIIGCNLAYIYLNSTFKLEKWKYTVLEIVSIVLVVVSNVVAMVITPKNKIVTAVSEIQEIWWACSLVFIISTGILIYIFAIGQGSVSKVLVCNATLNIAKLSAYAYLIHNVVLQCLEIM